MPFNYIPLGGAYLTTTEQNLLEDIDNHPYVLTAKPGMNSLGDLHNNIKVYVSNLTPSSSKKCIISCQEFSQMINDLYRLQREFTRRRNSGELEKNLCGLTTQIFNLDQQIQFINNQGTQLPNGDYRIDVSSSLLGEYKQIDKAVYLYINNIHNYSRQVVSPKPYSQAEYILECVYVHEMMHAAFDCGTGNFIEEIEEPITEFSMLKFFESFGNSYAMDEISQFVQRKKDSMGFCHYALGWALFTRTSIDWTKDYVVAKQNKFIPNSNSNIYVATWSNGIYPSSAQDENVRIILLDKALHTIPSTNLFSSQRVRTHSKQRQYIVIKNSIVWKNYTGDNKLVCGFIEDVVLDLGMSNFAKIDSVFNNHALFHYFRDEIVSDNINRFNRKIPAIDAGGHVYYISSGRWGTQQSPSLQRFCECVNFDHTIFNDYEIYYIDPTGTHVLITTATAL